MLTKGKMRELELLCYSFCCEMFSDFVNPENRGENFKWENFNKMVSDLTLAHVEFYVPKSEMRQACDFVEMTVSSITSGMLLNAGFLEGDTEQ